MNDRQNVESLSNGLSVLLAFTCEEPRLTISQVATNCELNRATTRRYLLTLISSGYLETDGKRFWATSKALGLGASFLHADPLIGYAQSHLQALTNAVGALAFLAYRDERHVVYVAKSVSSAFTNQGFTIGARVQLFSTAAGMVIAAALPEQALSDALDRYVPVEHNALTVTEKSAIRAQVEMVGRQGFSVLENQYRSGIRGIAVPLADQSGASVKGAISVNMFAATETTQQSLQRILPHLREAALQIQNFY